MGLGKFTYFSLGLAAVSATTYDEINRDGANSNPTYYSDATSEYRIPGWMKKGDYATALMTGNLQTSGNWDTARSAISLGPGSFTTSAYAGKTTWLNANNQNAAHNSFISAVRSYHTGANGAARSSNGVKGRTPYASPETGSNDPYAHIKNFWLRDGHLFALILDDNANDMIHGGVGLQKQTDVAVSETDGNKSQRVIPMDHHMEHLREFCQYMGGDLWAPSSQAEYDDLMERNGGICDQHVEVMEGGNPLVTGVNSKIEIYLNIHRQGYLRCPDKAAYPQKGYQSPDDDVALRNLACPSVSKPEYGTAARDLSSDGANNDWATFMTSDPWFAEDISVDENVSSAHGMCNSPNDSINQYAFWRLVGEPDALAPTAEQVACQNAETDADKPYINPLCFSSDSKHRFQKFVESDQHSINDVLDNTDSVQQLQKDCVVTTCNNDVGTVTGPNGDARHKSEWNMDNCNLQRHTGICRIRAFGCNTATFRCKSDFTRFCGAKSVYVKSITSWADSSVTNAVDASWQSDITNMIQAEVDTEVMFSPLADMAATQAFINGNAHLAAMGIVVEEGNWASFEQCVCECPEETCSSNMAAWNNAVTSATLTTDALRGLSYSANKVCTDASFTAHTGWAEGSDHTWSCQNDQANAENNACDCYSGSASTKCVRKANGYESEWVMQTTLDANVCADNCCETYTNAINSAASMTSTNRKDCMKRGDEYTVCCSADLHILGEAEDVRCRTFTVPLDTTRDCFTPLQCKEKTCSCQEKENGYCYREGSYNDFDTFENGHTLTCRCNEGYVNVGGVNHRPYDSLTCVNGVFDRSAMGTCVPVQCANPHDLLDADGNVIGKALKNAAGNYKSKIGQCIEYECADGYEWSGDSAPRSCCDDNDPHNHPSGQFGCYSAIVGGCKPIGGCGPPTAVYDNAWSPVIFASAGGDCHHDTMWKDFDAAFKARQPSQNNTVFNNGDVAVYECYDDFNAYKEDDFITLTRNIAWETGCAAGTLNDPCRLVETDVYVNNWLATSKIRTSGFNDKIVSYCENGQWIAPSHQCLCPEEISRREAEWVFTCDMVTPVTVAPPVTISGRTDEEETREPTSSNKVVLTVCGLIPAVFLGMN